MIPPFTTNHSTRSPLAIELEARRMRAQMLRAGAAATLRGLARLFGRGAPAGPVVRA